MKKNKITKHLKPLVCLLMISLPFILTSQNLAEVEGTTEIKMNSTSGSPHLRLIEDDLSSGGTTRMAFQHSDNMSDEFELRAYLSSSTDKRIGFSFNNSFRVVWNETDDGFGIGTSQPESKFHVLGNSSGSKPTALLEESQDNDFARLFFTNSANPGTRWALSSNTGTTDDHLFGFYYNGSPRLIYNETDGGLGIGTTDPGQLLEVEFAGSNGVLIDGDGTGDSRLWLNNDGGNHFLFDDASDGNNLKIQFSNDFVIQSGLDEIITIDGTSGDVGVTEELSVSKLLTAQNDIELRGNDPRIDFWNPSPANTGASIVFDENSSSGGNAGDLEIINYQVAGEIEFYTSTSNLNIRMNDTNIYSYEDFGPWTHKTTDLGGNGKAWDNVYYDDLINQGAASFNDRIVTEELLLFPPKDKKPGDFDYMTERGDIELDPNSLPESLSEDNGILTDEMTSYNYKANYEQQLQINDLKEQNKKLEEEIQSLKKLINEMISEK